MIVYAHRGASAELPENTLEAFRLAVELGVDALETDVHLTRDGAIVVHHDPTGLRTASTRDAIARLTLEEVRRWNLAYGFRQADGAGLVNATYRVPTLSEFLEAFPDIRVNLDIKPPRAEAVRAVIDLLRRHRAEERVLLTSFYDHVVRAVRAAGWGGETGLARGEVLRVLAAPAGTPRWALPEGVRAQIPLRAGPISLARETLVRRIKGLGYAVDYWVVNSADDARLARDVGADGVMTDDPRTVVGALGGAT